MAANPPPRYIHIAEAARRIGLDTGVLTRLVLSGKMYIKVIRMEETLLVSERWVDDMARRAKNLRDQFWPQVAKLEDQYTVSSLDATEIYGLNTKTVSRLVKLGIIRSKEPTGFGRGYKRLLNKADVEYIFRIAQHSKKHGGGRGHRLIGPDTLPPHMLVPQSD